MWNRAIAVLTADRAVAGAGIAVAASVAVALARVTGLVADDDRAHAAIVIAPPAAPLDLSPIHRFAPFGIAGPAPGAAGVTGFELRSIMLARPRSASSALIAAAGAPAKLLAVGDMLPGGAILDAVEVDRVVLRVAGERRTLVFPRRSRDGAADAASPATTMGPLEVANPPPANEPDPLSLLGSLGATATAQGFRVGAVPSDDMRRAGLLAGDIVEKVDGAAVGDPAHDRALYDTAVVAGQIRVDVVRAGKHIALSLPLP